MPNPFDHSARALAIVTDPARYGPIQRLGAWTALKQARGQTVHRECLPAMHHAAARGAGATGTVTQGAVTTGAVTLHGTLAAQLAAAHPAIARAVALHRHRPRRRPAPPAPRLRRRRGMSGAEDQDAYRLALRVEGRWWVAYYAQPDTMTDAVELGRIRIAFVQELSAKQIFMALMRDAVGVMIKDLTGEILHWPEPEGRPAPPHEKAGRA